MSRLVHGANAALAIALLAVSIYVYPELPARIPLHFGADGTPDRWGERTLLSWLLLPLIGIGMLALMYGLGVLIMRRPKSFNMPDKRKLLELPPQLRTWVMRGAVEMMHVTALAMLVMFSLLQYGAWRAAQRGSGSGWISAGVIFGLVAMPFVTIGYLVATQRRLDRAWHLWRTRGETAGIPS